MNKFPLVMHADWSKNPKKRIQSCAYLQPDGNYRIFSPKPVEDLNTLLHRIKELTGDGNCALIGFDFPIGIPLRYAKLSGIDNFMDELLLFGKGRWEEFYEVAQVSNDISLTRPFYPNKPGSTRFEYLLNALGVNHADELRRACEVRTSNRRSASPLFWTMGPQQVGKAAICGWRDVLSPGLRDTTIKLSIWPFSGNFEELSHTSDMIVVETYPAEYYSRLELPLSKKKYGGKGSISARVQSAQTIIRWANDNHIEIDPSLEAQINEGFASSAYGDDGFDAVIGIFGMLNVILSKHSPAIPDSQDIQKVEGWIFGQSIDDLQI